ncbi:hypothetical protein HMPREF9080_01548 [Cardiobacterium valvarum F0432]|uniref:Uncharacterized protein n=1 Tax=Cardiobacterium valvarum F0432 TaxID=797473 RepID=G9ZFK1_9GAMM|nr:hypothetical protein HMPREF9080_01548 [Cardiobacterium valvarum F0432]
MGFPYLQIREVRNFTPSLAVCRRVKCGNITSNFHYPTRTSPYWHDAELAQAAFRQQPISCANLLLLQKIIYNRHWTFPIRLLNNA